MPTECCRVAVLPSVGQLTYRSSTTEKHRKATRRNKRKFLQRGRKAMENPIPADMNSGAFPAESGPATWQDMLAVLVDRNGGAAKVAAEICKVAKRNSATGFETAKRNLENWLSGASLPRRQNFVALTTALHVGDDARLMAKWTELYKSAKWPRIDGSNALSSSQIAPSSKRALSGHALHFVAALVAIAFAGAIGAWLMGRDDGRTIGYLPYAELKVGHSVLVHAKRGKCGQTPPEWPEMEHEIPTLATGRLIDDGLGTSLSTTCGGKTPGRLVRFIAEKPGDEIFDLFQRKIHVVVKP